jgi:hypothetical protein
VGMFEGHYYPDQQVPHKPWQEEGKDNKAGKKHGSPTRTGGAPVLQEIPAFKNAPIQDIPAFKSGAAPNSPPVDNAFPVEVEVEGSDFEMMGSSSDDDDNDGGF